MIYFDELIIINLYLVILMIYFDDLSLVATLARVGSLVEVSKVMHISASAVSQRLTALEDRLKTKIAIRKGRAGIILTYEGELLAEQGNKILEDIDKLHCKIAHHRESISGKLHVIAPFGFGKIHIAPLISTFVSAHPDVSVALTLSDELNKYPPINWDIIIKVSPSDFIPDGAEEIANNRRILCASPGYIAKYGVPLHPSDLYDHQCISIYEDREDANLWRFTDQKGNRKNIRIKPHLSSNDGEVAKAWTVSSAGILIRSEWSVRSDINSGNLVELMKNWSLPSAPIVAIMNATTTPPIRSKYLMEYLFSMFKKQL